MSKASHRSQLLDSLEPRRLFATFVPVSGTYDNNSLEQFNLPADNVGVLGVAGRVSDDGRFAFFTGVDSFGARSRVTSDIAQPGVSQAQIYRRDLSTGTTRVVTARPDGVKLIGGLIDRNAFYQVSADGQRILFATKSTNVSGDRGGAIDWYIKNMATGSLTRVTARLDGSPLEDNSANIAAMSDDGRYVAFYSQIDPSLMVANGSGIQGALYLRDTKTGTTTLITHTAGQPSHAAFGATFNQLLVGPDGKVFFSCSNDFNDPIIAGLQGGTGVFVYDPKAATTHLITRDLRDSTALVNTDWDRARLSADGKWLAFVSASGGLTTATNDTSNSLAQAYLYDVANDHISLISHTSSGEKANGTSSIADISRDGRYVLINSDAGDLDDNIDDTNNVNDAYVYDRTTQHLKAASITRDGFIAGGKGLFISDDGDKVVFRSTAPDIVDKLAFTPGNGNYLRDMSSSSSTMLTGLLSSKNKIVPRDGEVMAIDADASRIIMSVHPSDYPLTGLTQASTGIDFQALVCRDEPDSDAAAVRADAMAAKTLSKNRVALSWKDRANNETAYRVERADSPNGPWSTIAKLKPGATSYTDTLSSHAGKYYRVETSRSGAMSNYSSVVFATASTAALASVKSRTITVTGTDGNDLINVVTDRVQRPKASTGFGQSITVSFGDKKQVLYVDTLDRLTIRINAGKGNDTVDGNSDNALFNVDGGDGNDYLYGNMPFASSVQQTLSGGAGNDVIATSGVPSSILGGDGDDEIYCPFPDITDTVAGGAGNDSGLFGDEDRRTEVETTL